VFYVNEKLVLKRYAHTIFAKVSKEGRALPQKM